MSHLPILIPGRTAPVLVPCQLPPSIHFAALLPFRGGVRPFCMWLSSTDPLKAEVKDVTLAMPEKEARYVLGRGAYALDEDETTRAWEAAGDVLEAVQRRLGLDFRETGKPNGARHTVGPLAIFAAAWRAEVAAYAAQAGVIGWFRDTGKASTADDLARLVTDINAPSGWAASPACEALRCYVDSVVDAACIAQADKAEKQVATWEPPPRHPEDENPPAWAERYEVTP